MFLFDASAPKKSHLTVRDSAAELENFPMLFAADTVLLNGKQLYFPLQATDSIPLTGSGIPEMENLTAYELWAQFGLAIGGILAPPGSAPVPEIHGIVGARAKTADTWNQISPFLTNQKKHYAPAFQNKSGERKSGKTTILRNGWNFFPVEIEGTRICAMVCLDQEPPTFEWDATLPKFIHPDDLIYGFMVAGRQIDHCGHVRTSRKYRQWFRNLHANEMGIVELEWSIKDAAGNTASEKLSIKVTPDAPRRGPNVDAVTNTHSCGSERE